jgi:HAE1 family hydrophobic/amphiphilic exporter-1
MIDVDFIPTDDESAFQVTVEAPEGTTLAAMTTIAERIAKDMRVLPGVTDTPTTIGGGTGGLDSGASSVNSATIFVKLTDLDKRDLSQSELTAKA